MTDPLGLADSLVTLRQIPICSFTNKVHGKPHGSFD